MPRDPGAGPYARLRHRRTGGEARRPPDRQQRLSERRTAADRHQRRARGRRRTARARLLGDNSREPVAACHERGLARLRQGDRAGRYRAVLLRRPRLRDRRPELPAADRHPGGPRRTGRIDPRFRISSQPDHRPATGTRRPHDGARARRLPQQPVRSGGRARNPGQRRARLNDARRRRLHHVLRRRQADRARPALQCRPRLELRVYAKPYPPAGRAGPDAGADCQASANRRAAVGGERRQRPDAGLL